MKRRHVTAWALAAALAAAAVAVPVATQGAGEPERDASELLQRVVDNLRGGPLRGTYTFLVERPGRTTEYVMEIVTDGDQRGLIRIVAPPREAGQAFLMDGNDLWLYNPRLGRTLRLPPSGRSDAFLGSDVSYNDMIGRDLETDYTAAFAGPEETIRDATDARAAAEDHPAVLPAASGPAPVGAANSTPAEPPAEGTIVLELTPRPGAPTPYGRVLIGVEEAALTPKWVDYYDQRGRVVKRLTLAEYLEGEAGRIPTLMVVEDWTREGYHTVLRLTDVELMAAIPAACFTLQALERGCR